MNRFDWIQVLVTLFVLIACAPLLGRFFHRVFTAKGGLVGRFVDESEMDWKRYAWSVIVFNGIGLVVVYLFQILQQSLPLNPAGLPAVTWHSAINTAVSFVTNTNWQGYAGETTMSSLTQMAALTVQNFVSAATGMAVAVALMRGMTRKSTADLGNFWSDLVRGTLYILLPFSVVFSLVLAGEGVVQTFSSNVEVVTLEGAKQTIPLGPAASQIAIKQLGTNGGGFFNTNSAFPLENPTPLSNWLEMLAILLLPAGFALSFGEFAGSRRQGWALFAAMLVFLVGALGVSLWSEFGGHPAFPGVAWMEGKETRFGVVNSVIWSVFTTAASNGSVNAMHSSLTPLAGGVSMFLIMLGEIVFGGLGSGLYGMILFAILTVFIAGLMVGRSPEYLGKKIEAREIQMAILAVLLPSAVVLIGTAASVVLPAGLSSLSAAGPHGFSEILYALTSAANNNGSAFAGLNANTPYYNLLLAFAMLVGRFGVIFPVLAIAGNLAGKKIAPASSGTFATDSPLFVLLLVGVILIVGGLTFFPALVLGPIVEHLLILGGRTF
ncbi:MAG: potassium-transporting ATPase subunit KdpA [Bdellovibrionales bacterium]|nr:potassium-transporting ATPase subunit KdpA [Bdellovibrionales bacterium]